MAKNLISGPILAHDDEIVLVVWLTGERPYFQSDHSANHRYAASTVWSCAGPEFRLSWMKLCRSDNHYTTTLNYPTPLHYTTSWHYTTLRHYNTALIWPKLGPSALSVTRYHGQLSPCTISENNDPILRKLSDGQRDRWEWFHRSLSD